MQNVQHLVQNYPTQQSFPSMPPPPPMQQNVPPMSTELPPPPTEAMLARNPFSGVQQQLQDLINFNAPPSQPEQPANQVIAAPSAPTEETEAHTNAPAQEQSQQVIENAQAIPAPKSTVSTRAPSIAGSSSSRTDANWTYVFATKGITGYVRHVKNLSQRLPYHRNFCTAQDWVLPDGKSIKVELVHALHPDAPFICLFDYDNSIDMFFVQTLLDGNGQEIHKIDSFSNSYQGFTPDQLLQSAEIDDFARIRIEAIVDLD